VYFKDSVRGRLWKSMLKIDGKVTYSTTYDSMGEAREWRDDMRYAVRHGKPDHRGRR
jgi:hypothetical protein